MSFSQWVKSFSSLGVDDLKLASTKPLCYDKIRLVDVENDGNLPDAASNPNEGKDLPFAGSNIFDVTATLTHRYTRPDGKHVFDVNLEAEEITALEYEPGDTIGILTENTEEVVNTVLTHLGLEELANKPMKIFNDDLKKKYLPEQVSLRHLFKKYINFHAIPMKRQLLALAQHTQDPKEERILIYLASAEGAHDYANIILNEMTNFLAVLTSFPSCRPPVNVLIQLLPRLLPRPYSIASSKLSSPSRLRVVFSILPNKHEGLCTGMIRRKFLGCNPILLQIYWRKLQRFRLPDNDRVPLILVGPGTGVSPYLGFLDHLRHKKQKRKIYLFTGFRNKRDFIFRSELEEYLESGLLTKMFVSYSRETKQGSKYVQDSIKENWKDVGNAIIHEKGLVYECGDIKKMKESVADAFANVVQQYSGTSREEAEAIIKAMKNEQRYLQDIWL